ncbi:SMP-30/gluconolactonase/LRE family protein [Lutimonas saemankumensis]|uniref:SMP-30/gluconolactonase/LRE family protein n=1 Tax=Lutimonas saemankumensis TaxID=483016 RepID=UPI001CD7C18C|nr:SMP-30/gluconolactonase/LRE family protein [Lutimonas saemankumensis]MCA0931133.1 SMP-30/gluconolactonase/LRE family protein [Lutimonas saemankumensis]
MQSKFIIVLFSVFVVAGFSNLREDEEMKNHKVGLSLKINAKLGEGAFWDHKEKLLYWVDIEDRKVFLFDPLTKSNQVFETPSRVGTVVPKSRHEAVIALEDGIYILNTESGNISLLSDVESKMNENRFNDGKCDPNGNLWVGSMHLEQTAPKANLYKISPSGESTKMLDSITISNGIVWTRDKSTMYYIDTPTGHIRAFDYDLDTSEISNERIAVVIPESLGYGDGMAIDEEDKLWVALWNGNSVVRFDPESGELMEKIIIPAHNVTSCSFGGPNFETLYITTSSLDMNEEESRKFPDAGSIFEVKPGVRGVKGNFFGQ